MSAPNTRQTNIPGLDIPTHDDVLLARVGSTNNLDTIVYRLGGVSGTLVATVHFEYFGGVPATDDADIQHIYVTKP